MARACGAQVEGRVTSSAVFHLVGCQNISLELERSCLGAVRAPSAQLEAFGRQFGTRIRTGSSVGAVRCRVSTSSSQMRCGGHAWRLPVQTVLQQRKRDCSEHSPTTRWKRSLQAMQETVSVKQGTHSDIARATLRVERTHAPTPPPTISPSRAEMHSRRSGVFESPPVQAAGSVRRSISAADTVPLVFLALSRTREVADSRLESTNHFLSFDTKYKRDGGLRQRHRLGTHRKEDAAVI